MSTKADLVKNNPAPEAYTVEAKFYACEEGEEPTFVVIDGVVYQRSSVEEQDKIKATLGIHDIVSELAPTLTEDQCNLLCRVIALTDEWQGHENEAIISKLSRILPACTSAISRAFYPQAVEIAAIQS